MLASYFGDGVGGGGGISEGKAALKFKFCSLSLSLCISLSHTLYTHRAIFMSEREISQSHGAELHVVQLTVSSL